MPIKGTGFTLRPSAIVVRNGKPVDLSADPWDADGNPKPGLTPAQQEELLRRRYGGAIDREGLHVNVASECLQWAWENVRDHPEWNRPLPASEYTGPPATSRERTDCWMTRQGDALTANCPGRGRQAGNTRTITPPELRFETSDSGIFTKTFTVDQGTNTVSVVTEIFPQVKNAQGAVDQSLSLLVSPRRVVGHASIAVTLTAKAGVKPGSYTSSILLSGGASIKIPIPIVIEVSGESTKPKPEDPTPKPRPVPTTTVTKLPDGSTRVVVLIPAES